MAALPPLRRFLLEDFKAQKQWIGPLLLTLNNFMEFVVNALNKAITLGENTTGDIKTIFLNYVPTTASPASIMWSKPVVPTAVFLGNIERSDGANFALGNAVQIQWQMSTPTTLQVTNIVGVSPTTDVPYILTLVCFTG